MRVTREEFDLKLRKRTGALETTHAKQLKKLQDKQAKERAGLALDLKFKVMYELGEKLIKQAGIALSNTILQPGLSGAVRPAYGADFDKRGWQLELYYTPGLKEVPSRAGSSIRSFVGQDTDPAEEQAAVEEGLRKLEAVVAATGISYELRRAERYNYDHFIVADLAKLVDA